LLGTVGSLHARPGDAPPSDALRTPYTWVAAAYLDAIGDEDDSSLSFITKRVLHGDVPERFNAGSSPGIAARLVPGETYLVTVVAWSRTRRDPIETISPREGGPEIVRIVGANPAIILANARLEDYLGRDAAPAAEERLEYIISGLQQLDGQVQAFYAAELAFRPELHGDLDSTELEVLRSWLQHPTTYPEALRIVLSANPSLHEAIGMPSLLAASRALLTHQPTELDPLSTYPGLVRNAMRIVAGHGSSVDADLLFRWTASNAHLLAEQACEAIHELAPHELGAMIERRMATTFLHAETRRTLNQIQRRFGLNAE